MQSACSRTENAVSHSDEILQIDTPENVIFGYEIAGIGSRFMAALVDTLLLGVIMAIVYAVLFLILASIFADLGDVGGTWLIALIIIVSFILFWGYYLFFELIWNGQTPGKRLVKIRVIRADGMPVTLSEVLIRNLVRLVDFMPASYGVGVITMFISQQSQRLGDLAAGTLVIYDQADVTLESLEERPSEPHLMQAALTVPPMPADLRVDRLTRQDILLVEDYLRRRYELANSRRMGLQLVERIRERLELPPEPQPLQRPDHWLMRVLEVYRARQNPPPAP